MSNIYESALSFKIVRSYIKFTFKRFYGEYIVIGKENIPTDCPVIFAPNHTNALMDALAIHAVVPNNLPLIFLARADIFNNKLVAKVLNFMKIMPAFRMRDGVENLGRNQEIFDKCVEVLHRNAALGIMPEGNQETERFLRPLVKGIFRIAFAAQQKYGDKPAVKIVPVGLDFGDITKVGKHIIIQIGKPIEVSDYMAAYSENPVTATNEIREKLKNDLISMSLHLATTNYYECFETVTEVCNTSFLRQADKSVPDNTLNRFHARQRIAERLVMLEKEDPERLKLLDIDCQKYREKLNKFKLRNWVIEKSDFNTLLIIAESLLLICTLPLFIIGLVLNALPFFTPVYLRKKVFKAQFTGFFSSLQYALGIFTFPVFYMIQTILFYSLTDLPLWVSILFLVSQYPLGKAAFKWNRTFKKCLAKIHYKILEKKQSQQIYLTLLLNKKIISLFRN